VFFSYIGDSDPKLGEVVKVSLVKSGAEFSTFSLLGKKRPPLKDGELVVVRFVKAIPGKGVTVQITESEYGFIDITEISDGLVPNVTSLPRE